MSESTTVGKSKSPERILHHTFWYFRRTKRGSVFEIVYCEECSKSYPSGDSLRLAHPKDEYIIVKNIKHVKRGRNARK